MLADAEDAGPSERPAPEAGKVTATRYVSELSRGGWAPRPVSFSERRVFVGGFRVPCGPGDTETSYRARQAVYGKLK